jgi:hypothetical protein
MQVSRFFFASLQRFRSCSQGSQTGMTVFFAPGMTVFSRVIRRWSGLWLMLSCRLFRRKMPVSRFVFASDQRFRSCSRGSQTGMTVFFAPGMTVFSGVVRRWSGLWLMLSCRLFHRKMPVSRFVIASDQRFRSCSQGSQTGMTVFFAPGMKSSFEALHLVPRKSLF